ncbi:MAG: hypothetical protein JO179_16445 [Solirubrobacterales bacterium]|nr:hypothetical protein [Solirubrobacterales bacterium]
MHRYRMCPALVVVALAGLALLPPRAFGAAPAGCAAVAAHRTHPAIEALDPRPGAPRIFAMQYKQEARNVVSLGRFRTKIDCMLRTYVLPHLARSRPNVVVFNEDIGLAALGIGSRGRVARDVIAHRGGPSCHPDSEPCGALGAISALTAAYSRPVTAYARRLRGFAGLSRIFVAATDTTARGFLATFSALAKRYRLYMIGSGDLPAFVQSRTRADRDAFADPDLRPAPKSVYVATSPRVYNQVFMWGPRDVRRRGPDVLRNVVASNRKVPLTALELALGLEPGPSRGPAALANLRPFALPGTRARLGFATSLPAFTYGEPARGVDPCGDTARYYMRCLDELGANLVIQDEANPGAWTGPDGNGIERWQPLSWMSSTYRAVSDPSVHFDYNVTAMMVGNLSDLVFDGQSAITQRGLAGVRRCHYIGNRAFVAGEDQAMFRRYAGAQAGFLALAPWVVGDRSRAALRRVGSELAPGSGSRLENDYVETALIADLPFPVDRRRPGCASGR